MACSSAARSAGEVELQPGKAAAAAKTPADPVPGIDPEYRHDSQAVLAGAGTTAQSVPDRPGPQGT